MRLFVGIPLDKELLSKISEAQDRLKSCRLDVKWVEPGNLHLTLQFLGELNEEKIPKLQKALQESACEAGAFDMELFGAGRFPEKGMPRVIWIGILQGAENLKELARNMGMKLRAAHFRLESREFNPHLTLGRVRSPGGMEEMQKALGDFTGRPFGAMRVENFRLIHSKLSPSGPSYAPLAIFPLGASVIHHGS